MYTSTTKNNNFKIAQRQNSQGIKNVLILKRIIKFDQILGVVVILPCIDIVSCNYSLETLLIKLFYRYIYGSIFKNNYF